MTVRAGRNYGSGSGRLVRSGHAERCWTSPPHDEPEPLPAWATSLAVAVGTIITLGFRARGAHVRATVGQPICQLVSAARGEPPQPACRRDWKTSLATLERALDAAIRDTAGAFVLDFCDVEFLDSSGLGVLLRARALLGREDRALVIVCPPGPVLRLFEMVGIADPLFLYPSREGAARALVPAD